MIFIQLMFPQAFFSKISDENAIFCDFNRKIITLKNQWYFALT